MTEYGKRLIPVLIDEYAAHDPERLWGICPIDDGNIAKGLERITYRKLANLVNHAAWWLDKNLPEVDTLAYFGQKDIRYPILTIAALKTQKKILLCSGFATSAAQIHLLRGAKASVYLHSAETKALVESIAAEIPSLSSMQLPSLQEWMSLDESAHYPYSKTWDEVAENTWLFVATSGTTGLPKLLPYTVEMMSSLDLAHVVHPKFAERGSLRWYNSLPNLHIVGILTSLQYTVYLGGVIAFGPPGPPRSKDVIELIRQGQVQGVILPPSQIEDICQTPGGLDIMRKLDVVVFVGAPLPAAIAAPLKDYVKIVPGMGSSEGGGYWSEMDYPDSVDSYKFSDVNGFEMRKRSGSDSTGVYELVIVRDPRLHRFQNVFKIWPHLEEYATRDLFTPHPVHEGVWRYAGRLDDMVNFTHGESISASRIESIVQEHPHIRAALVGGEGQSRPFLILDLQDDAAKTAVESSPAKRQAVLDAIWPSVERANALCSERIQLTPQLTVFADIGKPLPLTVKGTVARRPSLDLYADRITKLYEREVALPTASTAAATTTTTTTKNTTTAV